MSFVRVAIVIGALGVLGAGGFWVVERSSKPASAAAPTSIDGRTIWLRDCAVCHKPDGSGSAKAPDIRHSGTASVDFMVTTGRMPLASPHAKLSRHAVRYTKAQIAALVHYTSTLTHGPDIPHVPIAKADLAKGSELYSQNCSTCHQAAGGGGALAFGQVAPALKHATPVQVVEAMRTGPGTMPVFGPHSIDKTQATQIAAYVQELRNPRNRGGAPLGHLGPVPEGLIAWIVGIGTLLIAARFLGTRNLSQTAHAPGTSDSLDGDERHESGNLQESDHSG